MNVQQFQKITATFKPIHIDTLRDECKQYIGQRLAFYAGWIIEEGRYAGQMAYIPLHSDLFYWLPEEDLEDIEIEPTPQIYDYGKQDWVDVETLAEIPKESKRYKLMKLIAETIAEAEEELSKSVYTNNDYLEE